MSNAEIIVYCGITLTLAIGCLGELKVWIIAHDAKKKQRNSRASQ